MNKQSLMDSLLVGPRATDGKDPLRDLPIGGRRSRREAKPVNLYEVQLLDAFRKWMKCPTTPRTLETLSGLMRGHEIRAYNGMAKNK